MNIDKIKYFVEISKEGSITAAAKKNNISQTALTQQMNELEKELGVKLLNRTKVGTTLTDKGKIFIEKAKRLLVDYNELIMSVKPRNDDKITIAYTGPLEQKILLKAIPKYQSKYPHHSIELKQYSMVEMKNALINIKVEGQQEFNKDGKDIVKFLISTNLGEDEKELIKIASGGEMSRVMLAIKKVLSDTDKIPVMIFDEIDTGISGNAANAVAEKLSAISNLHQVLCISHLPNIAAVADYNYYINKNIINNRTNTSIKLLKEQEVLEEIARISSGEVNEITIKYASKLRSKKAS